MNWVKDHITAGILAVIGTVAITWFTGLLNKILPSPSDTLIWIREFLINIRRTRPSPDKFLILVARLDKDDPDGTHTRAIARAFQGQSGVERTQTRRVLRLSDIGSDAESRAIRTGRRWLSQRKADLLIWGEVLQKEKFLSLWFTSKDATSDFQQSRFPLEANLLDQRFSEIAREKLISVALSAIKPATESGTGFLRDILGPVAVRLRHLLNSSSTFSARQRSELRFALGVTLCALSDEGSGPTDLQDAVNSLGSSLEDIDRGQEPLAWANAQHYRGVALMELSREVAGSETIEDAVLAFRSALDERTREHVPLEWAKTQNALGGALAELGMRNTETGHFNEAMIAFDASLTERTLERTPVEWASTMSNRGITILNFGLRDEIGIHQIKDSIKVLQEALRGVSPKTEPILWGTIQLNLGVAFFLLAQRQPERGPLDRALFAYRSALSEWSRDQVPRLWVKAQLGIGRALTRLGELDIESDYLKEAEETFNAALEICPRASSPLSWARINASLGVVFTRIAERELGFQIPLPVIPVNAPGTTDWVTRQQTLALNLGLIQRREHGLNCLERAVTAFRNSLGELPRDRLPVDWAETQHSFSLALVRLGEHEEDTEHLYQALAAVNFALEEWTFESFPFDWATAQNTLAWVLIRLGERETETRILRFESAVVACRKSFQVQRRDSSPFQWALTQNTLGLALHGLGESQNDIVKLMEAESAYSSALEVFRAISDPKHVAYLGNNLRIVQALIEGHRNIAGQEVRP